MAKSISNITIKLLLFCLLLLSGEAFAQTTTIRGGGSDNVAEVSSGALAGTEKGLVIRCASGCAGSGGTSATDKGVFTASTTLGTPAMGAMDDVASSTCGEDQACITRMTANRAIHVNLRDALGNELSIGGGTQYAQGTVATDTDTMNMMGCERADTAAAQTGVINGDRANCLVDATQRLYTHVGTIDGGTITTITNPVAVTGTFWQATQPVSNAGTFAVQAAQSGIWTVQPGNAANTTPWLTTISQGGNSAAVNASGQLSITCANCSGSGASAVDNSAFTVGTTSGAPAMGLFDDTLPSSATEDRAAALRMSAKRALYVNIRDNAGNERGLNIDANGALAIGSVPTDPFGANADAASATGSISAKLRFIASTGIPVTGTVTVGSHAVTNAGTFATQPAGSVAHDAVGTGVNPLMTGCYASAAAPIDVSADGDATRDWCLRNGSGVVNLASGGTLITVGQKTMTSSIPVVLSSDQTSIPTTGNVAHDGVDSGNPAKVGGRAIAHGTNPTAVAAADRTDWYFNRAGVPFVIGGHPNSKTTEAQVEDIDGAQTNAAIVTVAAGVKIVVTRLTASCDASNSGPINIVVGFGTASIPARAHTGSVGVLHGFDGIPAGGGFTIGDGHGILGIGADDEDLRITTEDPVGGACSVSATYYTIES